MENNLKQYLKIDDLPENTTVNITMTQNNKSKYRGGKITSIEKLAYKHLLKKGTLKEWLDDCKKILVIAAIENSETITEAAIKLDIQRTYLSRLSGGYKETENVKLLTID